MDQTPNIANGIVELFQRVYRVFAEAGGDEIVVIAIAATIVSSFIAMVLVTFVSTSHRRKFNPTTLRLEGGSVDSKVEISTIDPDDIERFIRVPELESLEKKYSRQAKRAMYSNNSLAFAQYVIGGVLVSSSFVQQALSARLIGWLGVLVLVSSAIHSKFRPDLVAIRVKSRQAVCKTRIREGEDGAMRLKLKVDKGRGIDDVDELLSMRSTVTQWIKELERDEAKGLDLINGDSPPTREEPKNLHLEPLSLSQTSKEQTGQGVEITQSDGATVQNGAGPIQEVDIRR